MRLNKTAVMLAVAGLALASGAAWSQVAIGTNTGGTITTGAPNTLGNTLGTTTVPVLTATNGGSGITTGTAAGFTAQVAGAGTGLASSAHDFSTGVTGTGGSTTVAGLCTYCHTPHKAKSTLLLWNHNLSANTFQWDVAATTAGTALPGFTGNAYNGPSAKCLSCHDGSVAIGDVGWFNEAPASLGGTATITDVSGNTSHQVGKGGNLSGTHPVAIPYPLNGAPGVYNGSTTGAQLTINDWVADPSTASNIRLYTDVGGGAIVGKTTNTKSGIECSSCHDPHNKATTDGKFLRGKMTGNTAPDSTGNGYICLACHKK